MDVFAVYIEMTQNIRHYTREKNWSDQQAGATVVVSRDDQGRYVVSAGNLIETADGQVLPQRCRGTGEERQSRTEGSVQVSNCASHATNTWPPAQGWPDRYRPQVQRTAWVSLQPVSGELSFISLSAVI